ncbi:uncharacterized protein KQ657_003155 [Scheffersomyces spartinae]|uniref:Uncharacterized protein n=1 Tax=Scheffersomyces spartinae TaxID=45513 RepID=A0A9P7VCQ8_9ASCO|nr:uncharacterized protein KQ657_003155 [Scheffersomyces spartinae]KAG7195397.1 hypothetical protein KQ657_003155 [Scheffersomyces spartinae]
MKTTLIVLATALAGISSAASSSSASCSFLTTITAQASLNALNACPTLDGTIEINGDAIGAVDLGAVESIKGDVTVTNSSSITSLVFSSLANITGSLDIVALTQLSNIDFTSLSLVKQLKLISLPSLATLNLNKGISKASHIEVSDTALSAFPLSITDIDYLDINNNKNITSLDLPLETVSDTLILSFNNDEAEVKLDNLIWASNLTIQDISSLSASNLTAVNGSFVIAYNLFDEFELDSLKSVGGSLRIINNEELKSLSFKDLTTIGGEFNMVNNSKLSDTEDAFNEINTIRGAVNIAGDFSNFTMDGLKNVAGDFSFESTNDNFSCDAFDQLHDNNDIKGHNYNCSAPTQSSSASSGSSKSTSGSSSKSGSSTSGSSSGSSSSSSTKASNGAFIKGSVGVGSLIMGGIMAALI